MEVILLENVENLGQLGDRVKVRAGFGRNYLLPQGKAKPATAENIRFFEEQRAEYERRAAEVLAEAQRRAESLAGLAVTIKAKAGEEGKLFGSVGTIDIAQAVTDNGVNVERHEVRLPEGPLRATGEYDIDLHLHAEVDATVRIVVEAEA